jgi:CRISPR-associated protein Csx16
MTIWFISRHPGAREWSRRQGIDVDQFVEHLQPGKVQPDDQVIGTLPVHLAAEVCTRGGRYLHLTLDLPDSWRGRELSADDMQRLGACIEEYRVERVTGEVPRR